MEGDLNELRRKLDEAKGKLEVSLRTIKAQKEEIEALQKTSMINGNLVVNYENALKVIYDIYKNGGTAYRISKKALGK